MNEMVERVARAIVREQAAQRGSGATEDCCLDPGELDVARAAIAAMREPTAGMNQDGIDAYNLAIETSPRDAMPDAWHAMIDAALEESFVV